MSRLIFCCFLLFQISIAPSVHSLPEKESFLAKLQERSPEWMDDQIRKDLAPYTSGIDQKMIEDIYLTMDPINMLLVRFQIIDNHLYMHKSSPGSGRETSVEKTLRFLIETVGLPNLDIVMTLHDGFYSSTSTFDSTIHAPPIIPPIFSFAKGKNMYGGILFPDFEALEDYRSRFSAAELQSFPWENKEKKAFWRGSTTGGFYKRDNWFSFPRSKLGLLSLQRPDLLDAKFTNIVQNDEHVSAILHAKKLVGGSVSPKGHIKYRYLVDVDGNSCTYSRGYWILLSNSLLLKQVSEHTQWYYGGIKPYQHYIPLADDVSDVFEKIEWARAHDDVAKRISEQASEFAQDSLSIENIYIYCYKLLLEYARLQSI